MKATRILSFWRAAALCLVFVASFGSFAAPKAPKPSPSRSLMGPLSETNYRPRVRFTAGKANGNRLPIVATFSTLSGFVDRIEVRVDGKVTQTLRPGKQYSSGKLESSIDLSKVGSGSHQIKLWAWQGREGYQRLHGESLTLKINR